MYIIYDNIIFSLQKAGGISKYWSELIKRLKEKDSKIIFYEPNNSNIFRKQLDIETKKEFCFGISFYRYLPFLKKIPSKSIFHSSYYRICKQKNVVNITTVHDFTYEYFRYGLARTVHVLQKGDAIKYSDGIICVSENTKSDLIKFYPKVKEKNIKVIYNGVGEDFFKIDNPKSYLKNEFEILKNKKYILFVGDRSSYKNFNIALSVIKQLNQYILVVVGGKDFNNKEKKHIKEIKDRIFHVKGVDGNILNILYNNAFCLLYPSSYEGFGIPIIEAMKAGCPVVSTNKSSIPEVAGDAALLVEDIVPANFINEITKLENDDLRKLLIEKGFEQAKKFSWDKCFEETYSFYKEIWKMKFGEGKDV